MQKGKAAEKEQSSLFTEKKMVDPERQVSSVFQSHPVAAKLVPKVGGVTAITTIIVCYLFAAGLHHVKPWLPDITHCARHVPEKFIFRAGMIPSCVLIAIFWWLYEQWFAGVASVVGLDVPTHVRLSRKLGQIGAGLLVISSSVIEGDGTTPWTVHIVCASGFFVFTVVAELYSLKNLEALYAHVKGSSNESVFTLESLWAKRLAAYLGTSFILANITMSIVHGPAPLAALTEWLATFSVIMYILSFAKDFAIGPLDVVAVYYD